MEGVSGSAESLGAEAVEPAVALPSTMSIQVAPRVLSTGEVNQEDTSASLLTERSFSDVYQLRRKFRSQMKRMLNTLSTDIGSILQHSAANISRRTHASVVSPEVLTMRKSEPLPRSVLKDMHDSVQRQLKNMSRTEQQFQRQIRGRVRTVNKLEKKLRLQPRELRLLREIFFDDQAQLPEACDNEAVPYLRDREESIVEENAELAPSDDLLAVEKFVRRHEDQNMRRSYERYVRKKEHELLERIREQKTAERQRKKEEEAQILNIIQEDAAKKHSLHREISTVAETVTRRRRAALMREQEEEELLRNIEREEELLREEEEQQREAEKAALDVSLMRRQRKHRRKLLDELEAVGQEKQEQLAGLRQEQETGEAVEKRQEKLHSVEITRLTETTATTVLEKAETVARIEQERERCTLEEENSNPKAPSSSLSDHEAQSCTETPRKSTVQIDSRKTQKPSPVKRWDFSRPNHNQTGQGANTGTASTRRKKEKNRFTQLGRSDKASPLPSQLRATKSTRRGSSAQTKSSGRQRKAAAARQERVGETTTKQETEAAQPTLLPSYMRPRRSLRSKRVLLERDRDS